MMRSRSAVSSRTSANRDIQKYPFSGDAEDQLSRYEGSSLTTAEALAVKSCCKAMWWVVSGA
jgi:hypothetical protein